MNIARTVVEKVQGAAMAVMEKVVEHAPDALMPGGTPDPLIAAPGMLGQSVSRLDGPQKVSGSAPFAAEFAMADMTFAALAYSTIAKGRIASLDTAEAERAPGVVLDPFGSTGARIMTTLLNGLEDGGGRYGLETMCVGGGQGMAMIVERLT